MDPDTVAEVKRHFEVVAEGLRSELRAVAEAQVLAAERLESRIAGLEERMEEGFQELQSMIRLSYVEIDRRFKFLESEVHDLRTRVERLEARSA